MNALRNAPRPGLRSTLSKLNSNSRKMLMALAAFTALSACDDRKAVRDGVEAVLDASVDAGDAGYTFRDGGDTDGGDAGTDGSAAGGSNGGNGGESDAGLDGNLSDARGNGQADGDTDAIVDASIDDLALYCAQHQNVGNFCDYDGDGIRNDEDSCPATADYPNIQGTVDADNDGINNSCDECPAIAGMCEQRQDSEGDGVPDAIDNCRDTINPDQADADSDGVGDECDCAPDNFVVNVLKTDGENCGCILGGVRSEGSDVGECVPTTWTCIVVGNGTATQEDTGREPGIEDPSPGDEDCDGTENEGSDCDEEGERVVVQVGNCTPGYQECERVENGDGGFRLRLSEPIGVVLPTPEGFTFDGVDNDCNLRIDDIQLGIPCNVTRGADCIKPGVTAATFNLVTNQQEITCVMIGVPAAEACDGVDNDLDCVIDNGPLNGEWANQSSTTTELTANVGDVPTPKGVCAVARDQYSCAPNGRGVIAARIDSLAADTPNEVCGNQTDDNCDGRVNETCVGQYREGQQVPCGIDRVGPCRAGNYTGQADGTLDNVCAGQIAPAVELCDGIDNDCDGETDEDFDMTERCAPLGKSAQCAEGTRQCAPDHRSTVCIDAAVLNVPDVCNELDDNCNGQIDEGRKQVIGIDRLFERDAAGAIITAVKGQELLAQEGECADRPSTAICARDGSDALEASANGIAVAEICDGIDNDCNGPVDDRKNADGTANPCDCDPAVTPTRPCGTDFDAQAGVETPCEPGTQICLPNRHWDTACNGAITPAVEVCEGVDANCDGRSDAEEFGLEDAANTCPPLSRNCREGAPSCADDGSVQCEYVTRPNAETLNGQDDNCNGQTDEGAFRVVYPTSGREVLGADGNAVTGELGEICLPATGTECTASRVPGTLRPALNGIALECSSGLNGATAEVCDAKDNNCDGIVDNRLNADGTPNPCNCLDGQTETFDELGLAAPCRPGERVCRNGQFVVTTQSVTPAPSDVACDGIDNECNGTVDDRGDCSVVCPEGPDAGLVITRQRACDANGNEFCPASVAACAPTPPPAPATAAPSAAPSEGN